MKKNEVYLNNMNFGEDLDPMDQTKFEIYILIVHLT